MPYEVPAIALRKGHLRYNLVAGQYRPANADVETPPVAQATVAYGLPWNLTAFIGEQWSRHYQATSAGLGGYWGVWRIVIQYHAGNQSVSPSTTG